jgi:hypothetical protein
MDLLENPNCKRTYVTFRLLGDLLSPSNITSRLGIAPSKAFAKGEMWDKAGIRQCTTGIWKLSSKDELMTTNLERHLVFLLERLEPVTLEIIKIADERSLETDFFCYWLSVTGHGGPEFSPGVLRRISNLNASLNLDFYGPFDD